MKTIHYVLIIMIALPGIVKAQEQIDPEKIIQSINNGEEVTYDNAVIKGDLDFSNLKNKKQVKEGGLFDGGNDKYEYYVDVPVKFNNCHFKGKIVGYISERSSNDLHVVMFEDDAIFTNCSFEEEVLLKYTEFSKASD